MSNLLPSNAVETEAWKTWLKFIILCTIVYFFCELSAESLGWEFSTKSAWLWMLLCTDTQRQTHCLILPNC